MNSLKDQSPLHGAHLKNSSVVGACEDEILLQNATQKDKNLPIL